MRENSSDGISYFDNTSLDLNISLIFFDRRDYLDFQSVIYSFTKPGGEKYNAGHSLELLSESMTKIFYNERNAIRVLLSNYSRTGEEISPPVSYRTDLTSASETRNCRITNEIMLKMIENPTNAGLVLHNVEICHLISRTVKKYKNNDNNIIYMSNNFHDHFDGHNLEEKIPTFIIQPIEVCPKVVVVLNDQEFCKDRVVVDIRFRKINKVNALIGFLKEGVVMIDAYTYRTELYFDNGEEAKGFLQHKMNASLDLVTQYDSTIEQLLKDP